MTDAAPVVGSVKGPGGRLRTLAWPVERPRGRVVVAHGLGEHAGRYLRLAVALTARGWAVLAYDQRGHGASEGVRGHVASFGDFVGDLEVVRTEASRLLPGEGPSFLYGHSMGGLVALRLVQTVRPDVPGVVLSAPWLATAIPVPGWKRLAAAVLGRVAPALAVPTGMDASLLTRDRALQAEYEADPLVGHRISAGLWDAVRDAQRRALEDDVPMPPTLLLVPEEDRVADPRTTLRWAEGARGPVEVERLPGFRHEPQNEVGREGAFRTVADWLDRTAAGAGGARAARAE